MKKILLTITATIITASAYAQTDSTNNRINPPDINNTNDGMNQNNNNEVNGNQNRDRDPNNQIGTITQDPNRSNKNQNTPDNRDSKMNKNKMENHPDGYSMQNGKVMIIKDGKMTVMEKEITLANGTLIMSNGNYMNKGGTKMMMKEGQQIDMMGRMLPVKANKDKNMYLVPDTNRRNDH